MGRQSTKHGPVRDEELRRETEVLEHGQPRRPHIEEWREAKPAEEEVPAFRACPGR